MIQLTKIYAAIEQQLTAYVTYSGAQLPSFGIGKRDVFEQHASPPHISWLPIGGPIAGPRDAGGDQIGNPRPLAWRQFATMAYVWANGVDATNELLQHLVAAMHAVSHGSYKLLREDWDVSGDKDAGIVCALTFSMGIPFVDETSPTVTLGSVPLTGTMLPAGDP